MLPLTRSRNRARFFGIPFSPSTLFAGGTVAGAWYDPSDLSTMFDSSAGTTPVAMPGLGAAVPVGLMLDKSQGLVLGPELVTNGTFDVDTTGWTAWQTGILSVDANRLKVENGASTISGAYQIITVVVGRSYKLVGDKQPGTAASPRYYLGTSIGGTQYSSNATSGQIFTATSTTLVVTAATQSTVLGQTAFFDNISVRELPGNHAISFNNTTARPELRARVNLLTYSEEFDNGVWTKFNSTVTQNAAVAPNGTTTAEKLIPNNGASTGFIYSPNASPVVGAQYVASVYVKAAELGFAFVVCNVRATSSTGVCINLATGALTNQGANGTYTVVDAGNGWWQVAATATATSVNGYLEVWPLAAAGVNGSYTGDGTSGIYIWGADLRPANIGANVPAYQRIADALTYDTSGFPLYLRFDGIDDSMYTPANLNLSGTDKVSVFAGVRKLSDAAAGILAELSADWNINAGTFVSVAPDATGASGNYTAASRGTAAANANQFARSAITLAPVTNVVTATHDIPGDLSDIRLNGAASGTNGTGDKGSGNFGTYPLYIGSRGNSSLWLNGHLYSLAVVGSAVSAGNIAAMESWVAGKTGIAI